MSDKKFDYYDDAAANNIEKLKSKYSDYGVDDEAIEKINKNIVRSNPDYNAFEADFADGFRNVEKDAPAKTAPAVAKDYSEEISASDKGMPQYSELVSRPVYNEAQAEQSDGKKKKKKKKKKSHKVRNTLLVLFILAVVWGALFGIDIIRVSNWQDPIFCIKTDEYQNGGRDFMGAFYKIQFHVDAEENISTVVLPWFVQGPNANLEKKNDKPKYEPGDAENANASTSNDSTAVEITIPADFIEEDITNGIDLTDEQKQLGYKSVILNDDSSVTYQIGKSDYDKEIARIRAETESKLIGIADDADYPSIKKVEFANDFSTVTLYVDKAIYTTGLDSFVSVSVYEWVGYYQSFAQKDLKCDLVVKDFADNSIIDQSKG